MSLSLPEEQFPLFRKMVRLTVRVSNTVRDTLGTGVLISTDGLILTSYHVIRKCPEPKINPCRLRKDWSIAFLKSRPATVVFADRELDIALLRCRGMTAKIRPAKISFDYVGTGSGVYRVGMDDTPLDAGHVHAYDYAGPVSRLAVSIIADSGASGGPLFDERLRLIGIVDSIKPQKRYPPETYGIPMPAIRRRIFSREAVWPLLPKYLRPER